MACAAIPESDKVAPAAIAKNVVFMKLPLSYLVALLAALQPFIDAVTDAVKKIPGPLSKIASWVPSTPSVLEDFIFASLP
ncbi:MAG: hypothetical protein ACRD3Q_13360 [Terriglobales bacterium]